MHAVMLNWGHLPGGAYKTLMVMAYHSLDADAAPGYWRGRDPIAKALGRMPPDEPHPDDTSAAAVAARKERAAAYEAVKVATRQLLEARAIGLRRRGKPKKPAAYDLYLIGPGRKGKPSTGGRVSLPGEEGKPFLVGKDFPTPEEELRSGTQERRGGTKTAQPGTSPATPDEYAKASKILAQLPDLGATYLAQVDHLDTLTEKVIEAARLARPGKRS